MLLDVTCCTGSIPSELGKLRALQRLDLSSNQLTGKSNVCLGVSGTFVVSDGAYVSNGIHDVGEKNRTRYMFGIIAGIHFSSYDVRLTTPFPARR